MRTLLRRVASTRLILAVVVGSPGAFGSACRHAPSRATSDRATSDRATSDRATSDRATSDRATSDRATSDRATSDRATSDRATSDRATSDRSAEDAVLERVSALLRAYREADVDALEGLIATNYVHVNQGSRPIGRTAWLEWNRRRSERLASGAWTLERYVPSEIEVAVYGKAAIVTGRVTASGLRDGEPWSSDVRFINFWLLEAGTWRRAGFQDAKARIP